MSRPPVKGELVVVALKAEKLDHKSPVKQDPFCIFRVGDVVKRTKTDVGGGLYPIWDDQVNIPVTGGQHSLIVQVFDKTTQPNNLMADGVIDLSKVFRESEHDGYFPLLSKGRPGGVIYLELTFYSAINNARPQQQVRHQYPPNHHPQGGNYPPHQQQFRPQHRPPPPQQQAPRPYPPQQAPFNHGHPQPTPQFNHVPPPQFQQQQQQPYGQHRPLPQPPTHQQHFPPQMRPSSSMGTAQINSPPMPAPLLSSPYNPVPSPGQRPNPYPNNQRQSYPINGGGHQPPAGFHDPSKGYPPQHQQPGFYPPQPQQRPMPGFNNGYPPY